MKTKDKILILDDDLLCMKWLWRWKLLSTRAINAGIHKSRTLEKTYRRLMQLEDAKYIQPYWSRDGKRCLWMLADKGYHLLNQNYPNQFCDGYKTENPNHDFWVTAVHLGDWLAERPNGMDVMTEQEIRRLSLEEFPEWIVKSKRHRPDGYWRISNDTDREKSVIALEVELSKKTPDSYQSIAEFYSGYNLFRQILWVVKSEGDIRYIRKHLESGLKHDDKIHSFTTIRQFAELGWQAKILAGELKDKTINDLLRQQGVIAPSMPTSHCLLDLRKYPVKSKTLPKFESHDLGLNRHIYKSKDQPSEAFRESDTTYEE